MGGFPGEVITSRGFLCAKVVNNDSVLLTITKLFRFSNYFHFPFSKLHFWEIYPFYLKSQMDMHKVGHICSYLFYVCRIYSDFLLFIPYTGNVFCLFLKTFSTLLIHLFKGLTSVFVELLYFKFLVLLFHSCLLLPLLFPAIYFPQVWFTIFLKILLMKV